MARYPATRQTVSIPGTQNTTLTTDVYFPGTNGVVSPGAGRCPVIVLGHGFSQSKNQHVNQGWQFATRGYLVLIPNSNAASDHSRYADDLRKCIDWIEARDADTNSLFFGRVRADRVGATGHSAGDTEGHRHRGTKQKTFSFLYPLHLCPFVTLSLSSALCLCHFVPMSLKS